MISLISESDSLLALDSIYYNFRLVINDTSLEENYSYVPPEDSEDSKSALKISGIKDFTFDINQGFDQGLKLYVAGEVEGVRVKGALSDEGADLQTRRISDIEKMRLELTTKNFYGGLGDLSLILPFDIYNEIEGVRLGLLGQASNINVSYALYRGQYKRLEFDGEEGKQGPYFLSGRVIYGSERIYVSDRMNSSRLLKIEEDYDFDYEQGIINFTNKYIITRNTHIIIEYQEATEDYQNIYQEADAQYAGGGFTVNSIFHRTCDDHTNPLSFQLTGAEIESLKAGGDDAQVRHTYADTSSAGNYDLVDGHFVYAGEEKGHYVVTFFYVGEDNGEYVYDPIIKGFVYQGQNLGNYTPEKLIPLPRDNQFYGLGVKHISGLSARFYGSTVDRNRFSNLNDNDNLKNGYEMNFDKKINNLSLNGRYINYDKEFYQPRGREGLDYNYEWNTNDTLEELAQINTGIVLLENLSLDLGYGLLNRTHRRRQLFLRPLFFYGGYEDIDTVNKYIFGLKKTFNNLSLYSQYMNQEMDHFTEYSVNYRFDQDKTAGLSGNYERDIYGRAVLTKIDFSTKSLSFFAGHRMFYDTTLVFGNLRLNVYHRGFGIQGEIEQSQRYTQKKDEVYIKVAEGTGNYVYDPVTRTYIQKANGDYIKQVIMLKDFQRVISRRYSLEPTFSWNIMDLKVRLFYLDETNFANRKEEANLNFDKDDKHLEINFKDEYTKDARYALEPTSRYQYNFSLNPGYKKLCNYYSLNYRNEKWSAFLREERIDYGIAIDLEIIEQPQVKPYTGYRYSEIFSDFFPGSVFTLQRPSIGLLLGQSLKKQGRIELNSELLYNKYNVEEVPYLLSANEPPGLTKIFTLSSSLGVGNNTIFSLVYRVQFSPEEKPIHNLKFQTRIKF